MRVEFIKDNEFTIYSIENKIRKAKYDQQIGNFRGLKRATFVRKES